MIRSHRDAVRAAESVCDDVEMYLRGEKHVRKGEEEEDEERTKEIRRRRIAAALDRARRAMDDDTTRSRKILDVLCKYFGRKSWETLSRAEMWQYHLALILRANIFSKHGATAFAQMDRDQAEAVRKRWRRKDPIRVTTYRHVRAYAQSSYYAAWQCLLFTLFAYSFILCVLTPRLPWVVSVVLQGLMKVRMFIIFHDCCHRSFFPSSSSMDWNAALGVVVGCLVMTPYSSWSEGHRRHHSISGNLNFTHDDGQTSAPWTLAKWRQASMLERARYLFLFGPLTYFTVVPVISIVVLQRLYARGYENGGILLWLCMLHVVGGYEAIQTEMASIVIMCVLGFLIFHSQHTFQGSYRREDKDFDQYLAAVAGSSYLQVPFGLTFFTLGIEYHHIHHLHPRVPCYNLKRCHDDGCGLFEAVPRVSMMSLFRSLPLSLYDHSKGKFCVVYRYLFS